MPDREPPGLSRRQVLAATIGGALLGSAWGMALGRSMGNDGTPGVTVAWNPDGFAALIEYRHRRVLLLDCPDAQLQDQLTQMVAGFMRQRIDLLLAPDATLRTLPSERRQRWKLSGVMATDPDTAHPQIGLSGRQLDLENLAIACRRIDTVAEGTDTQSVLSWYLDIRLGTGRMLIVPSAGTAHRIPLDPGIATLVVVADDELRSLPSTLGQAAIAAPADAPLFEAPRASRNRTVRLFRDNPVTFELSSNGVVLPKTG